MVSCCSLSGMKSPSLQVIFGVFNFFVVSFHVHDGLCIIDFYKINLGFYYKIKLE
jgi:hypothetical protein